MKPRILVLTAGFGEGHNAAARNLAAAFDASAGPGTARIADLFALASPRINAAVREGYLALIDRAPRLWARVYRWSDRSALLLKAMSLAGTGERRLLARILRDENPSAVCSTYPVYAFMMQRLAAEGRADAPHFSIVTDSISINSLWWKAPSAGWFVPNEDSAEVLRRAGIGNNLVHTEGFPVASFFHENDGSLAPPDPASGGAPRILYIVNSRSPQSAETARRLLAVPEWEITCAVGRDEKLRRELAALAAGRTIPAEILGWTDRIPRLLMTHHLVVSKAGGATTQEAIAARCPMIVNQIVPGQEEGNYELLRRHGAGARAETPDAVIETCRRAFGNGAGVWREWKASLASLARPNASRTIADFVLGQVSSAGPHRKTRQPDFAVAGHPSANPCPP